MDTRGATRAAAIVAALLVAGMLTAVTAPTATAAAPAAAPAVPAVRLPQLTVDATAAKRTAAGGTGVLRFPIRLLRPASTDVMVAYATANGSGTDGARAGTDYTAATGTVTIPVGATGTTVAIRIVATRAQPSSRYLRLNLSKAQGARLENQQAVGTLLADGTTTPQLNVGDAAGYRRIATSGKIVFPILLSAPTTSAVTASCATGAATGAVQPAGAAIFRTNVTIPAGATRTTVTRTLPASYVRTGSNFTLTCSDVTGATVGRATGTGSVLPGVEPALGVSLQDTSVVASADIQTAHIPLYELGPAAGTFPVSVTWRFNIAKGGTGTAFIPAGSTSTTIDIGVDTSTWCTNDETPCSIKILKIDVGDDTNGTDGVVGQHGEARVNIAQDATQAANWVHGAYDQSVEVGDTYRVPVGLTPPASGASYTWTTEDGTAVAGRDYVAASGTYTADGSPGPTIDVLPGSRPLGVLSFDVRFTPVAPAVLTPGFTGATVVIIDPIDTFRPTGTIHESSGKPLPAGLQVFFDTYPTETQVPVDANGTFALAGFTPLAATGRVVVPAGWTGDQTFSIPTGAGPGHVDLTVTAPA